MNTKTFFLQCSLEEVIQNPGKKKSNFGLICRWWYFPFPLEFWNWFPLIYSSIGESFSFFLGTVECAIDQTTYITEFESFILKEWKDKINPLGRKMKERICGVHSVVLFCPWFLCQSIGKEEKGKNWFSFLRVRNIFLPCQPLQQLWIPQKVMEVNPNTERNHVFWI